MSNIYDRGSKKWTAMMMPEHEELLRKMWKEQDYKEKPILDEQQKEDVDARLQEAVYYHRTVEVKHYNGRDFLTSKGTVSKIDERQLWLDNGATIKLEDVLDVRIDDIG
ncbi:YolD-like family protein [Lentibacillus halophilus]|uniref:YolD-like family protein n=1 Tax=Lentibacillus halophilus TaxID=295065 RepID=A0ABP3IUV4_9BACI